MLGVKMLKCELDVLAYRLLHAIEKIRIAFIGFPQKAKSVTTCCILAVVLFTTYIGIQDIGRCKWNRPEIKTVQIGEFIEVEVMRL